MGLQIQQEFKLNSLSPKVLISHIFPPRNINSTKSNISSLTLQEAMSTSIITRTANLWDLLENLFDSSSTVEQGALSSETSIFHFAEAGVTPIGDRS